jgi:pimeloyl-ACP methyl ester carboxylesterase
VQLPSAAGGNGGHIEVLIDEPNVHADSPTAPALVLLPSSMRDSRDLGTLAALLAQAGFRVLRPQPPGMGGSSAPRDGLTLHHLACDVAHTIATLGGGSAIVAGHAWGHFVARVTDLDHPHSVRGVVVLAGAARHFPPGLSDALDAASDTAQSTATRLAALQQAFFAAGNDPTPWLEAWHPHLRDAYRKASATPDKQAWWPVSHAPILDLQGAQDPWRPEATRGELRAALGDKVSVHVIANASHALPHEQPTAVATAIIDWARTLPVSGP